MNRILSSIFKYKSILLYGISISLMLTFLKWFQWKFFILDHSTDLYMGLIGLFFTSLGIWIARQFSKTKIIEKEVHLIPAEAFVLNEEALKNLQLTPREWEVLKLMASGKTNAEIAEDLFLSLSTVKTHASNLLGKMDVKNRIQAIEKAKQLKIIPYQQAVL